MAYYTGTRIQTLSIGNRFAEIRSQAHEALDAWRLYRRTLRELQGLSVRELNDLGIARADMREIALEATYEKLR